VKTAGTILLVSIDSQSQEGGLRTRELQLLAGHGLESHGEVEWRDGDLRHLLERHDKAFLRDSDIIDPCTSNGEVLFETKRLGQWYVLNIALGYDSDTYRVRLGDVIPHCVFGLVETTESG
jgi:hypothetical protein